MVVSVTRPHLPRTGYQAPLPVRWEALRNRLSKLSPSHAAMNLSCDEHAVDSLQAAVDEELAAKQRPPQQDLMTERMQDKNLELRQEYHRAWVEWKTARFECRKVASNRTQEIMRFLPPDWDKEFLPVDLSVSNVRFFTSYTEGKGVNDEWELKIWGLRDHVGKLNDALRFENETEGRQAKFIGFKNYDDLAGFKQDIRQIIRDVLREEGLIPKPKSSNKRAA